jgi:uncharacterized RDD family membrane protein YckC
MNENWVYGKRVIGRRIGAFLIDHVIITLLAMSPFFIAGFGGRDTFFTLFPVVMAIGLFGILLKDIFGRSIGKRLFGLYIAHEKGPELPVSAGRRILRNVPLIVWPVEFIIAAGDEKSRRLGDRLAKTRVVMDMSKRKVPAIAIVVSAFIVIFLIIFFSVSLLIRGDGSYKTAVEYIESREEIVNAVGRIEGFGSFPSGSVSYSNGYGTADLRITVIGGKASITVRVRLKKLPDGDWTVGSLDY